MNLVNNVSTASKSVDWKQSDNGAKRTVVALNTNT